MKQKIPEKYKGLNPNDVVFTPRHIAKRIVEMFNPSGKVLEPCKGEGSFLEFLPKETQWCEITEGKDFFDFNEKVDWIVTNPPYSNFNEFLAHSFELADNVVFLVPIAKVLKSWGTIQTIKNYGGIKKIYLIPSNRCGFPFGFPCGAFHFVRDYSGATQFEYAPEKERIIKSVGSKTQAVLTDSRLISVKEDLLRKSPNSLTRTFLNADIKSNFGFCSKATRN